MSIRDLALAVKRKEKRVFIEGLGREVLFKGMTALEYQDIISKASKGNLGDVMATAMMIQASTYEDETTKAFAKTDLDSIVNMPMPLYTELASPVLELAGKLPSVKADITKN